METNEVTINCETPDALFTIYNLMTSAWPPRCLICSVASVARMSDPVPALNRRASAARVGGVATEQHDLPLLRALPSNLEALPTQRALHRTETLR